MQHMPAVGSRVRPTLTNTHLVNLPNEQDAGYPLGPVIKNLFCCHWTPFEEDFSYDLSWLSVTVRALVPSKAPFSDHSISCGTPFWPPNCCCLVVVLPQCSVKINFDLFFAAYFNCCFGGRWLTMLWKYMIAASAGESVIVEGCNEQHGFLLVSSRNQGHLSLIAPLRHCLPSLRHVPYTSPQVSVTTGVRLSAMMDSHTTPSIAVWILWHVDAHKYDQAHMDARQR